MKLEATFSVRIFPLSLFDIGKYFSTIAKSCLYKRVCAIIVSRKFYMIEDNQEKVDFASTPPERLTGVPRTIQSVQRALQLLDLLANAEGDISLKELSAQIGLNPSTCHHLLATLAKHQFVGQAKPSRNYFLGPRVTELSDARLRQFNFKDMVMPELRKLRDATKESVHLMALKGDGLALLTTLESKLPVRAGISDAQCHGAAHAMAGGKAILAWLPEAEIARVIAKGGLERFTDKTTCTIFELMENLRLVRRNGYAMDNAEFQADVVGVGAAIRDRTGAVVGAVSVSLPEMRAEGSHLESVCNLTKECAAAVCSSLGSPGSGQGKKESPMSEVA